MGVLKAAGKRWVPSIVAVPKPEETSRAFAMRAVAVNGWPNYTAFYIRLGLSGRMMRENRTSTRLSEAFGIPADEFEKFPDRWEQANVTVAGERFPRRMIDLDQRRVCLHCVREVGWSPLEWELKFITVCGHHGPLVSNCGCGKPYTWSDRHSSVCNSCAVPLGQPDLPIADKVQLPHFQAYSLGRLGRGDPIALQALDDLPLASAVELVEALGVLLDIGTGKGIPRDANEKQRALWRDAGYIALTQPDTIDLVDLVEEYRLKTGIVCPKRPVDVLGFLADASVLHERGNMRLVDILLQQLGRALGYPVHDLWTSDYVSVEWCAAAAKKTVPDYVSLLQAAGLRGQCVGYKDYLFVPVDVNWSVTHRQ